MMQIETATCRIDDMAPTAHRAQIFFAIASRLRRLQLRAWRVANQKTWRHRWWQPRRRYAKRYRSAGTKAGAEARVPMTTLAQLVGVSRHTLYAAARGVMSPKTQVRLSVWLRRLEAEECHFERQGQEWALMPGPAPAASREAFERERERERLRSERIVARSPCDEVMPIQALIARLAVVERGGAWFDLADVADRAGLPLAVVTQARRGRMSLNSQAALSRALLALGD
jgi:hypothetical protein